MSGVPFEGLFNRIIKYLNPISNDLKGDFYGTVARENALRTIVLSVIYILLNTQLSLFGRSSFLKENNYRLFIRVFLLFAIVYSIYRLKQTKLVSHWIEQAFTAFYCFVLIFTSLMTSQFLLVRIGSMSIFIVTILATSAFLIRRPLVSILTNISAFLFFVFTLDHVSRLFDKFAKNRPTLAPRLPEAIRFEVYVTELLLVTVVSCAIAVIMYRFRVKVFMDHKIIEEKNSTLTQLAMQDSMTQLLNHKAIYDLLTQEIQRTMRYSLPLSVLLIDIDHFKSVNDTYGHQTGDEVIKKIAEILRQTCRETDYIGRYGGEEFLILLTNTTLEQAQKFSERVRSNIENADFGAPSPITISGGLNTYKGENAKVLVHNADEALYLAKTKGRNRIEISN